MDFAGMNCLVTGGSRGLGKACAEMFASKGAKVFIYARRVETINEVVKELTEKGHDVHGCAGDVTDIDLLKKLVEQITSLFGGKLHILVNSAGLNLAKWAAEQTSADIDLVLNTNVKSIVDMCQLTYPMLKASGGASVINLGSVAGSQRTIFKACSYSMSKSAIASITRTLACEWAVDNIRVNCVAPGIIITDMTAALMELPEYKEGWAKETPMKRVGQPHEVAGVVGFFASSTASFITGQTLYVDGGYTIRGIGY